MHITKLIITGASGYLGHRLVPTARSSCDVVAVVHRSRADAMSEPDPGPAHQLRVHRADLSDAEQVAAMLDEHQPQAIIHAAAASPGQGTAQLHDVNVTATENIARHSADRNIRLVTVSTDMVHNGRNAPFADDAPTDPINDYGRSKAAGEAAVRRYDPRASIVRTSLIYGLNKMDRGTAGFVQRLRDGMTLELFHDVIRQPVWVDSLALVLCDLALVRTTFSGTVNVVGEQALSRARFGEQMLGYWRAAGQVDRLPVNAIRRVSGRSVPGVPMDLRLSNDRAREAGWSLPGVDEVLRQAGRAG